MAPLVVDSAGVLIDGYRRFLLHPSDEFEAVELVEPRGLFYAAFTLNRHTRDWDETDCFLWQRWASELGESSIDLPTDRFSSTLGSASTELLALIARRKLTLRQAVLILESPLAYQPFFQNLFSGPVHLNNQETLDFIQMAGDVKRGAKVPKIEDLFLIDSMASILGNQAWEAKRKGAALLRELRRLRYPLSQKKSEDFTSYWRQLNFERNIQAKKDLFVERGTLEISVSAGSHAEMKTRVEELRRSMDSPLWKKIWEE